MPTMPVIDLEQPRIKNIGSHVSQRIIVIGATGTIGSAVASALEGRGHTVIRAGHRSGDVRVDLQDPASIRALYEGLEDPFDAVVSTAGMARFGPFEDLTDEDYGFSLRHKLMGNVNLIRFGVGRVSAGGSFTLTTGNLTHEPAPEGAIASLVGGALESFVKAAALELDGRYRVNAVSPGWIRETLVKLGMDPAPGTPADEVAKAYVRLVEGSVTGRVVEP